MQPAATAVRARRPTQVWIALAAAGFLFLAHAPFWRLPFYWDELGQFVPAALDIFQTNAWIPHSTVPNVHPPGLMAYLAGVWYLTGYSILATRLAMLALAVAGAAITARLGLRMGLQPADAVLATVFLCASPLFFAQSMMAQLDMPAMVFTILALLLFLENRIRLAALASVALVLMKETGIVAPALFGCCLWFENRRREALWFLLPVAPLVLWLVALDRATGHLFGNAAFTEYNVFYPLHPVRVGLALLRRLYYLFIGSGHFIGTIALVFALRRTDIFRTRPWRIAGLLAAAHLLIVVALGGAVLERYLLPLLPLLYIAFAASLSILPIRWRVTAVVALVAALIVANFRNPPYPFPLENNLAYTDFAGVHSHAAQYLERTAGDKKIATMFPLSSALIRPEYGYVSRRMKVREIYDFRAANLEPLAHEDVEFLVLYSIAWDPWGLMDNPAWTGFLRRFYQYEPPVNAREVASLLRMHSLGRWTQNGQWVEIYGKSAQRSAITFPARSNRKDQPRGTMVVDP